MRLADGPRMLFDGVDLALEPGARACLVGRNGAGKSTLLRVLSGRLEADGGDRFLTPGRKVVFVAQEPEISGETLLDFATSGGAAPHEAEAALQDFGLEPGRSTQGLSGGEGRRAALARAFAEKPDVLLLDEPTNHLDIFAIETLEAELRASRAAALIVSHDRAFLERTTNRCFWLEDRKIFRRGNSRDEQCESRRSEAMLGQHPRGQVLNGQPVGRGPDTGRIGPGDQRRRTEADARDQGAVQGGAPADPLFGSKSEWRRQEHHGRPRGQLTYTIFRAVAPRLKTFRRCRRRCGKLGRRVLVLTGRGRLAVRRSMRFGQRRRTPGDGNPHLQTDGIEHRRFGVDVVGRFDIGDRQPHRAGGLA